jgi:plastocyanin
VAALAAALALPAGAQAATKQVTMGVPAAAQKALAGESADVNDFFPRSTTIHVGDKVAFVPSGFHNADFPARGGDPTAFAIPTGTNTSGANDATGNAFWFNGQPNFGPNPALFAGSFGKTVKFDGAKAVNSGLPLGNKLKPFTVQFTKAGTFTYFCDIHTGMKATVHVVAKSHKVPSQKADAQAVKNQLKAATKEIARLKTTVPASGTVDLGAAGKHGVEIYKFFPEQLSVSVGTSVKFAMSPTSYEAHTATTGPDDPNKADTYLGKLAGSFESPQIDPIALYPSESPQGVSAVTTTSHGNGFWNSGMLDTDAASPLPASNTVRFDAPGTYQFYCLIHPFMHGTVTVK